MKLITELSSIYSSLRKDNYHDWLQSNGFSYMKYDPTIPVYGIGIYIFTFVENKDFDASWDEFAKNNPIPKRNKEVTKTNTNTDPSILYIGKSVCAPLNARVKDHYTLAKHKKTYALKINAYNKFASTNNKIDPVCCMYILQIDQAAELQGIYIRIIEEMLHKVLTPKVGSSR
ncbi:hypothetical protein [Wohlfahrtiimonas chitiniclastica]|uniref:hypothetical protein n=1 Tax=Wohlfahrtiimonas chitiniclastica TaxID=400946 RepID=UPI001BD16401|nr:hypothetical protein [Wohlfahrtiimonas chitiniclastica]MBS7819014.1 hypothetical protein [Wohlfahrtiimonas chitiniclastica]